MTEQRRGRALSVASRQVRESRSSPFRTRIRAPRHAPPQLAYPHVIAVLRLFATFAHYIAKLSPKIAQPLGVEFFCRAK